MSEHLPAADAELADLLAEVRRIQVLARRLLGGALAGGYNTAFRGAGLEFHELREYEPGDDPRTIDWNVTARTGRPHIRRHQDERDQTVVFAVDLTTSLDRGMGHWTGRQMAARLVACLALAAVDSGDRLAMALMGGADGIHRVAAEKGLAHCLRIVRDVLAMAAGAPGPDRVRELLDHVVQSRRKRSIVFLVSDLLHPGALSADIRAALVRCSRRHDVVALWPQGPELTLHQRVRRGLWRVEDPVSGAPCTVDLGHPRVQEALEQRVAAWRQGVVGMLRESGVDRIDGVVPLEADPKAIARPILEFFRQRAARAVAP